MTAKFQGAGCAKTDRSRWLLLVDDDDGGLAETFAQRNWNIASVPSAEEALALLETRVPEVIVTEVSLRGMIDGVELTRYVKTDARTRHVPVVVLTAMPLAHVAGKAMMAGCSACLQKPCSENLALAAVNDAVAIARLLARRRAMRETG
jgi:CheY-like chemotaxis protein